MRYMQVNDGMDRFFELVSGGFRPYLEVGDIRELVQTYSDELVTVEHLEDDECEEYLDEAADRFRKVWDEWSEEVFVDVEADFRDAFEDAVYEFGRPLDPSLEDRGDEGPADLVAKTRAGDETTAGDDYAANARAGFERDLPRAVERRIEEEFAARNLPPREYDGYFKRNVVRCTMRMMREFESETLPRMVRDYACRRGASDAGA